MSISTQATIKVEEYKGYQDHARMRSSIKIVQKRLGKGLLTKGIVASSATKSRLPLMLDCRSNFGKIHRASAS